MAARSLASPELADVDRKIARLATGRKRRAPGRPAPTKIRRILVGLDPDGDWEAPVSWAREFAGLFGARVTLASVLTPEDLVAELARYQRPRQEFASLKRREEARARRAFGDALAALGPAAKGAAHVTVRGFPSQELAELARTQKADLVVVGSHGHGPWNRILLGSVADSVKNNVDSHVLVARTPASPGDVLIPVDGSGRSRDAAQVGLRIARAWGRTAFVIHVFGLRLWRYVELGKEEFRSIIAKHRLPASSSRVRFVLDFGSPAREIVKAARKRRAALIVMGSRGLGSLRSTVLGGVSNRVSHESPASCLFVKKR